MAHRIMRIAEVSQCTALARSTIYKYITLGIFPRPIDLGPNASGWLESEIQEWIQERIDAREQLTQSSQTS